MKSDGKLAKVRRGALKGDVQALLVMKGVKGQRRIIKRQRREDKGQAKSTKK